MTALIEAHGLEKRYGKTPRSPGSIWSPSKAGW
jgi:hypothetical protein